VPSLLFFKEKNLKSEAQYGKMLWRRGRGLRVKNRKLLLQISISLNILFIAAITTGLIRMNFVKEQILLTEVQQNLIELEGVIEIQSENNRSEPNLVTTEMGDVLNGIWLGIRTGEQLVILFRGDKEILNNLYNKLDQYPKNEIYRFTELIEKDKDSFKELQGKLRQAGFGMNMQISGSVKHFINQAEVLEQSIGPINY
jgi:hypothetical protein